MNTDKKDEALKLALTSHPAFQQPESRITFHPGDSMKEVMRIDRYGVKVNPEYTVDEATQHVLNALSAHIQHTVNKGEEHMSKKDEALKLALEALEMYLLETNSQFQRSAVTAIREALAEQPAQQEPHCYMDEYGNVHGGYEDWMEHEGGWFPVYTSPPASKPWVGLTDEEMKACTQSPFVVENYRAIEAKLKEKNA